MYEAKPPISKAKMTSITKGAIRAIKFYKHVVQSVEKFIQKCKPEYKIPGLYVIDSIVRQSRHQFGPDKDVFAPRFAKNAQITFYHLYKCAEDEKSKVIRVLNLWQKNNVFHSDAIQPLFDMANPNSDIYKSLDQQMKTTGKIVVAGGTPVKEERREGIKKERSEGGRESNGGGIDGAALKQLQTIQQFLKNPPPVQFNKKLLDFDYGSDDDSEGGAGGEPVLNQAALDAVKALLGNPTLLNHLKASGDINQQQITQLQQLLPQAAIAGQQQLPPPQHPPQPSPQQFTIPGLGGPPPNFNSAMAGGPPPHFMGAPPPPGFPPHMGHGGPPGYPSHPPPMMGGFGPPPGFGPPRQSPLEEGEHAGDTDDDVMMIDEIGGISGDKRSRGGKERRRSRDRRSRSRSGSRGKKNKRRRGDRSKSRSRSRDRRGKRRSRSRERDREDKKRRQEDEKREIERMEERKKKGLPPLKDGHLTVCSTTLWVGHLSKLVQQDDLSDNFGTYGEIVSIDLIPPRGCAFVCMNRRMDANRALKNLNKFKLHGKQITLAWAPGKGMKDKQWKDYWDLDLGCSYIPIEKLDPQVNMMELEEGGMFDEETMPDWMRSMRGVAHRGSMPPSGPAFPPHSDGGVMPGMGQMPPGMPGMGPPHELGGMPPMPSMEGMHPPFGLPPPGGPPGLLGHPPGLLPPPGAPLIGGPGNLLLRPGFPHPGAPPMVSGPPPGFPGFDSTQPPPGVRMPGPPGQMPGVLGAPPGMPAGPPGLLQSPRPAMAGPPGLLGPPPGAAVPMGAPGGQGPMDLEEQEFDERRDRGRDRDRDRERGDRGHRDRGERDGDRKSSGRWEDRDDRRDRDRGDRGRDADRGREERRGSSRFGRDDDRGNNRRDSRWGRDEERRDRDGDRNRREGRREERDGGEDVGSRLQSMADGGGPVSLLDMPDIPRPEDMPGQEKDRARSEGDHNEKDPEREVTEGSTGGAFPPFGSSGPPFGSPGFAPPGFEGPPGFGGPRGFGGPQEGPQGFNGPPAFGSPGFDGQFRGRGGRGRGGWRGRGGPDSPFRGGPDMGFRGRGGPRGGRGGFGGPPGHWNEGAMEGGAPFGGPPGFGASEAAFDNFEDGFRGRGRGRGRGGRGGWEDRGRGRGGFGGFGEWDQEGGGRGGRGKGLLDGDFGRGGGGGGAVGRGGFGEWNQDKEEKGEKEKDSDRDEKREERRRDRKSRWGAKDEDLEQGEQNREGVEVNGQEGEREGGLEAHDAPKTPPDDFVHNEAVEANISNNESYVETQDNLAHQGMEENAPDNGVSEAAQVYPDPHQGSDSFEQNQSKPDIAEPIHQINQGTPEPAQEAAWSEPSNQEPFGVNESESSNQPQHEPEDSYNQPMHCEASDISNNQSDMPVESEPISNQPAYDLLGDLGAVVAPSFNQHSEGGEGAE